MEAKVNGNNDKFEIADVQVMIRLTEGALEKLERKIIETKRVAAAIINKTIIEEYRVLKTFSYYRDLVDEVFDTLCVISYPSLKYFGTCEMFSEDTNSCKNEGFLKVKEESQRRAEENYAEYILIAEKMQEQAKRYREQVGILRKSLAVLCGESNKE